MLNVLFEYVFPLNLYRSSVCASLLSAVCLGPIQLFDELIFMLLKKSVVVHNQNTVRMGHLHLSITNTHGSSVRMDACVSPVFLCAWYTLTFLLIYQ